MHEAQFQAQVVDYLALCLPSDSLFFAIPNGGWRAKKTGADLKRQGVKAGVADLVIMHDGRTFFLELKTPAGRLSKEQTEFCVQALKAGGFYAVARSLEQVQRQLLDWFIPVKTVQL